MPLWTILTKCPAPLGPQCSQPCSALDGVAGRRAGRGPLGRLDAWSEGVEDRRQPLDRGVGAADHQAVAALQAVDPATHADVDVVDAVIAGERSGPVDVVAVPRVAAVDDRVAALEQRCQLVDRVADERSRHHHPDVPRRVERADELLERQGADHPVAGHRGDGVGGHVEADALVAGFDQPADHVGAHPAEADHAELHGPRLPRRERESDVT